MFHPGYSGVALGLLHGSQPDGFVVCHDPQRKTVVGLARLHCAPNSIEVIEAYVRMGRRTNPAIECVGVSVNTSKMPAEERAAYLTHITREIGLPCVDPLIDGFDLVLRQVLGHP